MVDSLRPNPDRLLQHANDRPRGKLKIFFGACAGVGKTWAMLQEARRLHALHLDVMVGVVETHGRQETAALLHGLPRLPQQQRQHRGRQLEEFDLDAALAHHPAVILMDELAHSNAPGSRHPKRWQDVKELLAAGIDVLATVNVQHLESLNDIVNGVTGVQVRETLPDPFFDAADEIILVDLPPDDLLLRLKQGKVYTGDNADRAAEHFFRKGNLIALRELALRRAAERVDDQMQAWRDGRGREKVWHTRDAVLLCVGYEEGSEKLVRTAARLAARLGSEWHAISVETSARLSKQQRRTALASLRLARQLGAESAVLADSSADKAIARYAREHDLGKVVLGRDSVRRWFRPLSLAERLAARAPELDLIIVAPGDKPACTAAPPLKSARRWRQGMQGCLLATALCAAITFIASRWLPAFDPANLVMLYLLGVVIVALQAGRWPSVFATAINVIAFDLFFVSPRGTLAVSDAQYLLTFGVMLSVGLLVGNLTAGVRYQARIARHRERRTGQLYALSSSLAKARSAQEIAAASQHAVYAIFHTDSALLLPDENDCLIKQPPEAETFRLDEGIARWSYEHGEPAGAGTDTLPGVPYQILPLRVAEKNLGVMAVGLQNPPFAPEQQQLLETVLLLTASALERLQLTASEEQARVVSEREQLRHSLLAALSHDLRTPLTVLFGQVEILTLDLAADNLPQARQASDIRQHILRLTRLVNNLLDMARLQTGGFHLKREWLTLEEVIGSALATLEPGSKGQPVELEMADPLALIQVDGPLFERVLINLLENAMKYAGPLAQIGIRAQTQPGELEIEVWDSGPGLPAGQEQALFAKFSRGERESAIPGVGLGLAICQAIIDVHGGAISAHQRPQGGASFRISLPQAPLPDLAETGEAL
ncbi:two-component system sensor histidine kinase KdpD [Kalamiella sp. sgz302252]|uniref:two-component system sensor histidine kinase KdpD n=1 Tax=Pantoea sp. sgz302252 TaxID=3341827 RepID=UPI0036D35BCF